MEFLVGAQSRDGAWRSDVRGVFGAGDALTPLLLRALRDLPEDLRPRDALQRGQRWMSGLARRVAGAPDPWAGLRYPLFTACHAALPEDGAGSSGFWTGLLRRLQLARELGWPDDDPRTGGWSDAPRPVEFTASRELADMNNPNLSATACALDGLRGDAHRKTRESAIDFVMRCQNFRPGVAPDDEANDGGFFFTLDDSIRNKAGVLPPTEDGVRRFRSYGSATCDGFLCLVACGLRADHPRVDAAIRWLRQRAGGFPHPGDARTARPRGLAGLDFYFAQACAQTLRRIRVLMPPLRDWVREQRAMLSASLLARQAADGRWSNPEPDSFEDDPVLATAFALRALTADISV